MFFKENQKYEVSLGLKMVAWVENWVLRWFLMSISVVYNIAH
jgi:hypothetical protein